jgi:hypothetical protein
MTNALALMIVADVRTCAHLRVSVIREGTIDSDHWQPQPPTSWVVPDPFPGSDPDLDALAQLDRAGLDGVRLDGVGLDGVGLGGVGLDGVGPDAREIEPAPANAEPTGGEPWTDASLLGAPSGDPIAGESRNEQVGGDAAQDLLAYAGEDPGVDENPWTTLLSSDDPATSTLARWWQPPA